MQPTTHLFTIRVWQEEVDDGTFEWRGSIRSGVDGQLQYFVGLSPSLTPTAPSAVEGAAHGSGQHRTLGDVAQQMVEQLDDSAT